MYKNQLQELAQRSCFNLPSYTCIREGPDHAPRFKATVNFNGETFECPNYCTTLRQAEHSAAEVALNALAGRGPSNSLAARILDETGVYKNLLQEVSQRVGASLPTYTTFRSGLGHLPFFTCSVQLAGITFTGEPAKNKKQAEKNAAMAAWSSLKSLAMQSENPTLKKFNNDEQEHVTVARALRKHLFNAKMDKIPFPIKFPTSNPRPSNSQPPLATSSKILPLIFPKKTSPRRPFSTTVDHHISHPKIPARMPMTLGSNNKTNLTSSPQSRPIVTGLCDSPSQSVESPRIHSLRFPAVGAAPYIPVRHLRPHCAAAPPVTIRNAVPVFSAPPIPPPNQTSLMRHAPLLGVAPSVCIRQALPVFAAPPVQLEELAVKSVLQKATVSSGALFQGAEPRVSKALAEQRVDLVSTRTPIQADQSRICDTLLVSVQKSPTGTSMICVEDPTVSEMAIAPAASSLKQPKSACLESSQEAVVVKNLEDQKL